jgi:hypothetical protein
LVKQNFKKIVPSVEYFDEEKFEGGKRKKKKAVANGTPSKIVEQTATKEEDSNDKVESIPLNSPVEKKVATEQEKENLTVKEAETKPGKRKSASSTPSSQKKSKKTTATVKTKVGTFSVTDVS